MEENTLNSVKEKHNNEMMIKGETVQIIIILSIQESLKEISIEIAENRKKIKEIQNFFSEVTSLRCKELTDEKAYRVFERLCEAKPYSELERNIKIYKQKIKCFQNDAETLEEELHRIKKKESKEYDSYKSSADLKFGSNLIDMKRLTKRTYKSVFDKITDNLTHQT